MDLDPEEQSLKWNLALVSQHFVDLIIQEHHPELHLLQDGVRMIAKALTIFEQMFQKPEAQAGFTAQEATERHSYCKYIGSKVKEKLTEAIARHQAREEQMRQVVSAREQKEQEIQQEKLRVKEEEDRVQAQLVKQRLEMTEKLNEEKLRRDEQQQAKEAEKASRAEKRKKKEESGNKRSAPQQEPGESRKRRLNEDDFVAQSDLTDEESKSSGDEDSVSQLEGGEERNKAGYKRLIGNRRAQQEDENANASANGSEGEALDVEHIRTEPTKQVIESDESDFDN